MTPLYHSETPPEEFSAHGILYSPNKQIFEESLHLHALVPMADLLQGLIRGGKFHKSYSPNNQ